MLRGLAKAWQLTNERASTARDGVAGRGRRAWSLGLACHPGLFFAHRFVRLAKRTRDGNRWLTG